MFGCLYRPDDPPSRRANRRTMNVRHVPITGRLWFPDTLRVTPSSSNYDFGEFDYTWQRPLGSLQVARLTQPGVLGGIWLVTSAGAQGPSRCLRVRWPYVSDFKAAEQPRRLPRPRPHACPCIRLDELRRSDDDGRTCYAVDGRLAITRPFIVGILRTAISCSGITLRASQPAKVKWSR